MPHLRSLVLARLGLQLFELLTRTGLEAYKGLRGRGTGGSPEVQCLAGALPGHGSLLHSGGCCVCEGRALGRGVGLSDLS